MLCSCYLCDLNSNQSHMAKINNFLQNQILEINTKVIVPVDCSCVGNYSQAEASYSVQKNDTYFKIANNTHQGLSTCQALSQQNFVADNSIQVGIYERWLVFLVKILNFVA